MLIRHETTGTHACITQEQHAMLSGALAAAWRPTRLSPRIVTTIALHDTPWRDVDAAPLFNEETGLPHDFVDFPTAERLTVYRDGIDALEALHPYVAYMVSRHYTTFAGTRDLEELQRTESTRRARLRDLLGAKALADEDDALAWLKFFDVFSLAVCLTGPAVIADEIPGWLRDPSSWSDAPDGTSLTVEWRDAETFEVDPWPFGPPPNVEVHPRVLEGRAADEEEFQRLWEAARLQRRALRIAPA